MGPPGITNTFGTVWSASANNIIMDGATDQITALQTLYDAMPEYGTLLIDGRVRTSQPLVIRRNKGLRGLMPARWPYQVLPTSGIRPLAGFVGQAILLAPENSIVDASVPAMATARASLNDGWWIEDLVLDCVALPVFDPLNPIHGFYAEGLVRSAKLHNVSVADPRGEGFRWAQGRGTAVPRGHQGNHLTSSGAKRRGFVFDTTTDSHFEDCLAVGGKDDGIEYIGCTETDFIAMRSVFNSGSGHIISGSRSSGNSARFLSMSTDRNGKDGVLVTARGTFPILIDMLSCNRDGASSTTSDYAGLAVVGLTGDLSAPLVVDSFTSTVGFDDALAGNLSPQRGVRLSFTSTVQIKTGFVTSVVDGDQVLDLGNHTRAPSLSWVEASGQFAAVKRRRNDSSNLVVDVTETSALRVRSAAGSAKYLELTNDTAGTQARWRLGVIAGAESGANAGSDFELRRFTDAGVTAGVPLAVKRSNGRITIGDTDGAQTGLDVNRNSPGVALQVSTNYAGGTAATGFAYRALEVTSRLFQSQIAADGNSRIVVFADGRTEWGNGVAARDVALYRKTIDQLATDDTLFMTTQTVAQIAALGTPVGGGFLFVDVGALKYKGTSGTVTTIAPA